VDGLVMLLMHGGDVVVVVDDDDDDNGCREHYCEAETELRTTAMLGEMSDESMPMPFQSKEEVMRVPCRQASNMIGLVEPWPW